MVTFPMKWLRFIWLSVIFIWLGGFILYGFDHTFYPAIAIAAYLTAALLLIVACFVGAQE